jgi:hypothetical protein
VFDRDSLRFTGALTLGDLLVRVPGVFVARGGFLGQAEPALYGGRGAAGLEVYWDGLPYVPVGRDSVYLDVGRVPLAPLERVEVQVLPDRVRVDLITRRVAAVEPQTEVRVATGELDYQSYRAGFARRWASGLGVSLMAEYNNLGGDANTTTSSRQTDLWLKVEYVPRATLGASYQVTRSSWRRAASAGRVDGWEVARRDGAFRAFVAAREDGLGWRLQGTVASTDASGDSVASTRTVYQTMLEASHTWSRASAVLSGRLGYAYRPWQLELAGGWHPWPWLTVGGHARASGFTGRRHGTDVRASAGARLPLGFALRGEVTRRDAPQAPRLRSDSGQEELAWLGALRWEHTRATIEVARVERAAFRPFAFPAGLTTPDSLGPTPRTQAVMLHASLRPLPGLQLAGWYADPLRGGGDFEFPRHARYAATFHSKFWRQYKSGVFALRAEIAAESWSGGPAGLMVDGSGQTSQLLASGATFVDLHIELQIVGVTLFWAMRNMTATHASYVPGLGFPRLVQFYGAHWTFAN